jgi:hypothetical protein
MEAFLYPNRKEEQTCSEEPTGVKRNGPPRRTYFYLPVPCSERYLRKIIHWIVNFGYGQGRIFQRLELDKEEFFQFGFRLFDLDYELSE